tara:strand:+ start:547 stop:1560 length:1014 start_codon:yes stop_codon:yes gene_type:complete
MAANLNTISLGIFTQLATVNFEKKIDSLPQFARNSGLFKTVDMANNTGDTRQFEEIDLEEYASIKNESDQAALARVQQGYTKTLELDRFGFDQTISYEMRTRNKYPEVIQRLTNLAVTVTNKLDLDLSHRITFGTATSYSDKDGRTVSITVGDGLALFSTAHTLRGSASTYRNILANNPQVSKGALEAMEKMRVENTLNQFGEKMAVEADLLYTTDDPNTCNTVRELLQSTAEVSAPNSGVVNVYSAKYRHIKLPRLATDANGNVDSSKEKYWGLASSSDSTGYLGISEAPHLNAPMAGYNSEDVSTEDWTYTARTGYGIAIVGARWISLSKGNGDA